MRRLTLLGTSVAIAGVAFALGGAEIRCAFMGAGTGQATSTEQSVTFALGPPVVGRSTSASFELVHGPLPCRCDVVPTAVEDPGASLPTVARLHPNAPNPFNPSTTIAYDLPHGEWRVTLAIYDLGGRVVRTLVDETQSAGRKTVRWDGRDDSGRLAASGVYFCRLQTPQVRLTRKMTLLK